MTAEVWKPVIGYEGIYEVSSEGRVRSLDRLSPSQKDGKPVMKRLKGRILAQFYDKDGYPQVKLCGVGKQRSESIHRLACRAFHGPKPSDGHEVAHKDGIRTHNNERNLRWSTDAENQADRIVHGTDLRGEKAPWSRLTRAQATEIKRRSLAGEWSSKIAAEFGINKRYVREIATGKKWAGLEETHV